MLTEASGAVDLGRPSLPRAASGLRSDALTFWEVVAQSVANIAPSATPALIIPLVFASTGGGTWLAYAVATAALLLVALNINQFARRSATPGALYTFVGQGLGPTWGVISGWSLVMAYLFTASATLCGAANYAGVLLTSLTPVHPGLAVTLAAMALVMVGAWYLAYRDIELSTKFMLFIEFISVGLIVLLALIFLGKSGRVIDPHQLALSGTTAGALRLGLVLAIFSFVGFESATALGHEAKDPLRIIPRAVLVTVVVVGAFFTFMSYVLVDAFAGYPTSLGQSNAPLSVLAQIAGVGVFGVLIAAGATIGFFACALACVNAGARVIFAMSRHGLIHASAGGTHSVHATPHVAVTISAVLALVVPVALLLAKSALLDVFGYMGTLATFGFLFAYALVSIAAPFFARRRGDLTFWTLAVAGLSLVLLALPIIGSVYPVPAPPLNYLPYIFVLLLAAGVLRFLYLRFSKPQLIEAIEQDLDSPRPATAAAN